MLPKRFGLKKIFVSIEHAILIKAFKLIIGRVPWSSFLFDDQFTPFTKEHLSNRRQRQMCICDIYLDEIGGREPLLRYTIVHFGR